MSIFLTYCSSLKRKSIVLLQGVHVRLFRHAMSHEMLKFIGNLSWMALGTGISVVVLFFVNLIAARLLGPEEYGKYALILSVGQLFIIPMLFGLNTAATRYVAENPEKKSLSRTALSAVIGLSILSVVVLYVLKDFLFPLLKIDAAMYMIAIVYSFFLALKYIYEALLRGNHRFRLISFLDAMNSVVIAMVFFTSLLLVHGRTFQNYAVAVIAGLMAYVGFSFLRTRRELKGARCESQDIKTLLHYGGYATIGSISGFVLGNASHFVLNSYLDFSAVGLFAVYLSASTFLTGQITNVFVNVFFPTMSRNTGSSRAVLDKLLRMFRLGFIPFFVINSVIVVIILFVYGSQYELRMGYVLLFALNGVVALFYQILLWMSNSMGVSGVRFTVFTTTLSSSLFLVLSIFLTKRAGIYGAVSASLFINVVLFFVFRARISRVAREVAL